MKTQTIRAGTRKSRLAQWQTTHILQKIKEANPTLEVATRFFVTKGDRTLDQPLPAIGGKGLFTAELENALRQGEIDIAVHSLKDLPVENAAGLTIGAITSREDVHDVLISSGQETLATLPRAAVVGTSSRRRAAQLLASRPDLTIRSIRGNVDTRIKKVMAGEYDAAILAYAGVVRLGLGEHISEQLTLSQMLPAPGQGALAIQCRFDDRDTLAILEQISDPQAALATRAERAFLAGLGGGCSAPIAAYGSLAEEGQVALLGLVCSPDGQKQVRVSGEDLDPVGLGKKLADEALAQGAREILASLGLASRVDS